MTITIELDPQREAAARAQAEARGLAVEEYVRSLAERELDRQPRPADPTLEEWERDWEALCEPIAGLPPVSDEDFSRAVIYADHD